MFPTPTAALGLGGNHTRGGDRSDEPLLGGISKMLPTPTAQASRHGEALDVTANAHGYNLWDVVHYPERWGDYAEAVTRHAQVVRRHPPAPVVDGTKLLNPQFVEWMMMLPAGWVTDLELSRAAQLRILGNGVVPPQAAVAYRSLL